MWILSRKALQIGCVAALIQVFHSFVQHINKQNKLISGEINERFYVYGWNCREVSENKRKEAEREFGNNVDKILKNDIDKQENV